LRSGLYIPLESRSHGLHCARHSTLCEFISCKTEDQLMTVLRGSSSHVCAALYGLVFNTGWQMYYGLLFPTCHTSCYEISARVRFENVRPGLGVFSVLRSLSVSMTQCFYVCCKQQRRKTFLCCIAVPCKLLLCDCSESDRLSVRKFDDDSNRL
jgi:hypothetical protein